MSSSNSTAVPFLLPDDDVPVKRFPHGAVVFFHLLFRTLAIGAFLFAGLFSSSFVLPFIVILLLLSADFWTVKNISGRLLVGLRWWNYVDADGKSIWVYESRAPSNQASSRMSATESRLFWLSIVVCQVIWIVFFFAMLFTLNLRWLMVVMVGFVMNGANLYGYLRCRIGAKKDVGVAARDFLSRAALRGMLGSMSQNAATNPKKDAGGAAEDVKFGAQST